jgi:CheY-like chemotaxis protein
MANILIVDSYLAVGLLYREVLHERGHRVFLAMNGKDALVLVLHEDIDIAVVDDKLSDFKAEDLLDRLKHRQPDVQGILSVSSTFGPAPEPGFWQAIFSKTHDFRVLESVVENLCSDSSSIVSPLLKQTEEQEIAPRYT